MANATYRWQRTPRGCWPASARLDSAGLASRYENDTRRCNLVMKFVDRSADLDGHARGAGTAFPASGQRDRMRARSQPGDLGEGTVVEWPVDGRGPVEQFALGFVFLKVVALALEAYRLADAERGAVVRFQDHRVARLDGPFEWLTGRGGRVHAVGGQDPEPALAAAG